MKLTMEANWDHWSGPKRMLTIGNYTAVVTYDSHLEDPQEWAWTVEIAGVSAMEGRAADDLAAMREAERSVTQLFFATKTTPHDEFERYSAVMSL